jgi:hypothetical protein
MNAAAVLALAAVVCGEGAALHAWAGFFRRAWLVAGAGLVSLGGSLIVLGAG